MHDQNNLWQLVARHLSKETTEEENLLLKKIMEEDPYLQFSMEVLTHFWENNENGPETKKLLENQVQRLQEKSNKL